MSDLFSHLDDYLRLRRSLGFQLDQPERDLRKFLAFLASTGADVVTTKLALDWATSSRTVTPAVWASRLRAIRLFAKYLSGTDPRTEIPPLGLLPHRPPRAVPYIYSTEEISQLIQCASSLTFSSELRRVTLATVIGLLSVTGLRIGELVALDRDDVDLDQGILHIRRAKFGKSRLVALHTSTRQALADYAKRRDELTGKPRTTSFFVNDRFRRIPQHTLRYAFVRICREIGLRGPNDSNGPRLHDFRHSFAVKTLTLWYQAGLDPERELPKLSTFLGHVHWSDTYWYFSATPELMGLASSRLERAFGGLL